MLKDVTVTAAPNQVIAFAGPSGGGKSTIISLLERFYSPDSGHILIGDQDIANLNVEDWREQFGLVGQDATIMAGTIRYNLTYGATRNYTDEELWHVLDMAYAKPLLRPCRRDSILKSANVGSRFPAVSDSDSPLPAPFFAIPRF